VRRPSADGWRFLAAAAIAAVAAPAVAQVRQAAEVAALVQGLFCAPPEAGRRAAPGTLSGWVHVPDEPVRMVAEGTVAPATLGLGFGVRFQWQGGAAPIRYVVTHPPMGASGATRQTWDSVAAGGFEDAVFFQFDVPEEQVTGAWAFQAFVGEAEVFYAPFTVVDPAQVPELVALCQPGGLVSRAVTDPWAAD